MRVSCSLHPFVLLFALFRTAILRNLLSSVLHSHMYSTSWGASPVLTVRLQEGGPMLVREVLEEADRLLGVGEHHTALGNPALPRSPNLQVHVQVVMKT